MCISNIERRNAFKFKKGKYVQNRWDSATAAGDGLIFQLWLLPYLNAFTEK